MAIQRMSVREASECLGIGADGVRQRIRRGTLESEKDGDGRVYVWVDTAVQEPDSVGVQRSEVEEELRERIASLERQLERRDEELQRAHQLLGESLSQLRALNAPASSDEASAEPSERTQESHEEPPQRDESPEDGYTPRKEPAEPQTGSQQPAQKSPWWKRIFGG